MMCLKHLVSVLSRQGRHGEASKLQVEFPPTENTLMPKKTAQPFEGIESIDVYGVGHGSTSVDIPLAYYTFYKHPGTSISLHTTVSGQ
jgi:hypothetical protein